MLADDAAARRTGGATLARALARLGVARSPVPAGALGVGGSTAPAVAAVRPAVLPAVDAVRSPVVTRIARLLDPPAAPRLLPAGAYLAAAAVLAIPTSVLLLG
jgi:hypothetical protein